eukprot:1031321-Rhodomonas_salina.3
MPRGSAAAGCGSSCGLVWRVWGWRERKGGRRREEEREERRRGTRRGPRCTSPRPAPPPTRRRKPARRARGEARMLDCAARVQLDETMAASAAPCIQAMWKSAARAPEGGVTGGTLGEPGTERIAAAKCWARRWCWKASGEAHRPWADCAKALALDPLRRCSLPRCCPPCCRTRRSQSRSVATSTSA